MKNKYYLTITVLVLQLIFSELNAQSKLTLKSDDLIKLKSGQVIKPSSELSDDKLKWNQFENKLFTLNIGISAFLDYNILAQNDASIELDGDISPELEFRAERVMFSGELRFFKYPWKYLFSANYNGPTTEVDQPNFSIIDLNIDIPFGKNSGWLSVGKVKEGVGYEYVLPGSQAMFTERGTGVPALIKQRNIGLRYNNTYFDERMTFIVGVYNNWLELNNEYSFSDNGMQGTSRITGLLQYKSDRELIHAGVGYRISGSGDGKFNYKAKPEVNTAPIFIETGTFIANHSNTIMFEGLTVQGPVSFLGEFMNVFVDGYEQGNLSFYYYQIGGCWFITGDNRRYNKRNGTLGKLIPLKNLSFKKGGGPGAIEVGARFTQSNFRDRDLDGGLFRRLTTALSWYPDNHFRFEFNFGYGWLNKDGLDGKTAFYQFRSQYEL
ncbi:MAG TPA: porin [Ignavibacteria bacterium]|nr:porin [Ignavibacteria bacterium]